MPVRAMPPAPARRRRRTLAHPPCGGRGRGTPTALIATTSRVKARGQTGSTGDHCGAQPLIVGAEQADLGIGRAGLSRASCKYTSRHSSAMRAGRPGGQPRMVPVAAGAARQVSGLCLRPSLRFISQPGEAGPRRPSLRCEGGRPTGLPDGGAARAAAAAGRASRCGRPSRDDQRLAAVEPGERLAPAGRAVQAGHAQHLVHPCGRDGVAGRQRGQVAAGGPARVESLGLQQCPYLAKRPTERSRSTVTVRAKTCRSVSARRGCRRRHVAGRSGSYVANALSRLVG
jgi:hypothetical protein